MQTITFNEYFDKRNGNVSQIYTGQESGCRCGCHGRYFDPGTVGFKRALNRMKKLNPTVSMFDRPFAEDSEDTEAWKKFCQELGAPVEAGTCFGVNEGREAWVDFVLPNDRTITVYFG